MIRLLLAGLAIYIAPGLAFAQTRAVCENVAAMERDLCLRDARASNSSDRQCYSQYTSAISQCQSIQAQPVRPIQPTLPRPNR